MENGQPPPLNPYKPMRIEFYGSEVEMHLLSVILATAVAGQLYQHQAKEDCYDAYPISEHRPTLQSLLDRLNRATTAAATRAEQGVDLPPTVVTAITIIKDAYTQVRLNLLPANQLLMSAAMLAVYLEGGDIGDGKKPKVEGG